MSVSEWLIIKERRGFPSSIQTRHTAGRTQDVKDHMISNNILRTVNHLHTIPYTFTPPILSTFRVFLAAMPLTVQTRMSSLDVHHGSEPTLDSDTFCSGITLPSQPKILTL